MGTHRFGPRIHFRPDRLARDLASLLHPPHYLYINGERLDFRKDGKLTGKVLVLTGDEKLSARHSLSPRYVDKLAANMQSWTAQVNDQLNARYGTGDGRVLHQLSKLRKLFRIEDAPAVLAIDEANLADPGVFDILTDVTQTAGCNHYM